MISAIRVPICSDAHQLRPTSSESFRVVGLAEEPLWDVLEIRTLVDQGEDRPEPEAGEDGLRVVPRFAGDGTSRTPCLGIDQRLRFFTISAPQRIIRRIPSRPPSTLTRITWPISSVAEDQKRRHGQATRRRCSRPRCPRLGDVVLEDGARGACGRGA